MNGQPDNKKTIAVIAAAVLIVLIAGIAAYREGLFQKKTSPSGETSAVGAPETYSSEVPKNIELTKPALENLINPALDSGSKIRTFEINASKDGYSLTEIAVNLGDQVGIAVTAVDGDYDFDLPNIGAYQIVKKGERKWAANFVALRSGTYTYLCRDYCPGGDKISGKLIVKE